jgi:uncharacterized protein (TIGR02996 family)
MTQNEAFLAAIRKEPDDDVPRLVYADWLEDHGDLDRAEFIRLQVARAARPAFNPLPNHLLKREQDLLALHKKSWAAPVQRLAEPGRFTRGFIEEAKIAPEELLRHGDALLAATPLRRLTLRFDMEMPPVLNRRGAREKLIGLLSQVRELDLSYGFLNRGAAAALLDLPLSRLKALCLGLTFLPSRRLQGLCQSPLWDSLEVLEIREGLQNPNAFAALLLTAPLPKLSELKLDVTRTGDAGVGILAQSPVFSRLTGLTLGHNGLTANGVRALFSTGRAERLEKLGLEFNPLGVNGVSALAEGYLPSLRILNLSRTGLHDRGAAVLARSRLFGQLERLDLSLNRISNPGARALANREHPCRLRTLDVIYNHFGEKSRLALAERFGKEVCLFER